MNSIILCEGSTDYFLLQYYMREAYQWTDDKSIQNGILKMPGQKSRNLAKNSDILTIMAVGGCSQIGNGLNAVLERNYLSPPPSSNTYSKIIIVTDRDEVGTEQTFIQELQQILTKHNITDISSIANNSWIPCSMCNKIGLSISFSILLLIIPFEENGAMETFLLNAIGNKDSYDKNIINECSNFVDRIDPEKKYLTSRRYITKAKFDTYFSIRTPVEQYAERQNILKNIRWEQYNNIQTAFKKLGEL